MTLDEAIEHAEWCARESQGECSGEHMQLGEWLRELRRLRTQSKWLRKEYTALSESRQKEFARSCEAATNHLLEVGMLRDKNAELADMLGELYWCSRQLGCDRCTSRECCGTLNRMRELGIEVEL